MQFVIYDCNYYYFEIIKHGVSKVEYQIKGFKVKFWQSFVKKKEDIFYTQQYLHNIYAKSLTHAPI